MSQEFAVGKPEKRHAVASQWWYSLCFFSSDADEFHRTFRIVWRHSTRHRFPMPALPHHSQVGSGDCGDHAEVCELRTTDSSSTIALGQKSFRPSATGQSRTVCGLGKLLKRKRIAANRGHRLHQSAQYSNPPLAASFANAQRAQAAA
jgi:hypothetical protein